jgi:hypothetical protein
VTDDARPDSQPDPQVGWQPGGAGYPPYSAPSQPPYDPAQPAPQPPYGAPYPGIPAQPPPGQPYPVEQQSAGGPGWTNSTPPGGMPTVPMAPSGVPQQPVPGPVWSNQPPPVAQPWPTAPRTDAPRPPQPGQAAAPTSAAPAPVSASPAPQSGAPYSGPPYSPAPPSGAPSSPGYPGPVPSGAPASPAAPGYGAPGYGAPGYGSQGYGAPAAYGQGYQAPAPSPAESLPWGAATPAPAPSGYPGIDHTGPRRIVPSPQEPKRPKFAVGLAIGLGVAVLAGVGAFFLGSSTGGGSAKPTPSASVSPTLSRYEASQETLNKAKLTGALANVGQPWLAWVGGCVAPGDPGGPTLQADEKQHVFCRFGGVSLNFVAYQAATGRELNHSVREQQHADSATLVPGQQSPSTKPGGVTGTQGDYVEYGFKDQDGRQICGIWWSPVGDTAVVTMETLCQEGLGGDWDVFRELWKQHS